jgi:hypothetical protein
VKNTVLSNYVLNSSLTSTLSNYVPTSSLTNYALKTDISSFITSSSLSSYTTTTYLQTNYYDKPTSEGLFCYLQTYRDGFATIPTTLDISANSSLTALFNKKLLDISNTYLKSASLSGYATTASLSNYETISDLQANYPSNTSLTTTLSSYATTASLSAYATVTSLSSYASKSIANTFSAMQTFTSGLTVSGSTSYVRDISASGLITCNGGLTIPSGQTINLVGATILGPTPTVTFYSAVTTPYTIPAQTAMKIYFVFNGNSGSAIRFNLSDPGANYIGQSITIVNYNSGAGMLQVGLANVAGQGVGPGTTYNTGAGLSNSIVTNITSLNNKTFTYIGTGAVQWVCGL